MLSRRLSARGYTVGVAEDGAEALAMIEAERLRPRPPRRHDAGTVGLRRAQDRCATTHSRERPARHHGHGQGPERGHRRGARGSGANDYVTKPIDFAVVLARTETQLALKRATHEIRRLAQGLELRNQFIRATFGRYLSDDVVAGLLEAEPRA